LTSHRGFILDTNVVSEPTRPAPDPAVQAWMERQATEQLFLTTTIVCELAVGIERLPKGRRRQSYEIWLDRLLYEDFRGRVLHLDLDAALTFGRIVASAYAQGRRPHMGDAQIAAVAARERMAIATRDIDDFEAFGVPLVNPWRRA